MILYCLNSILIFWYVSFIHWSRGSWLLRQSYFSCWMNGIKHRSNISGMLSIVKATVSMSYFSWNGFFTASLYHPICSKNKKYSTFLCYKLGSFSLTCESMSEERVNHPEPLTFIRIHIHILWFFQYSGMSVSIIMSTLGGHREWLFLHLVGV